MEFNKSYNRQEFINFLQNKFLPEDFNVTSTQVTFRTKMKYSTQAVKLGSSESLDLVVYEVRHTSTHDARVSLSKEAFRMLADELEDRALVVFVPEDNNNNYRFSFIEITLDLKDDTTRVTKTYSNPRRYSYLLGQGIAYYTPNKYLNEKGRVVNDADLRSRFSVEVLTKEFYQELSDWYAWAINIIRFPNDLNDKTDDNMFNNESAIRLITRLIFVWFLKQRHLVPDEFFDEQYIADNLIEGFNPHAMADLFGKSNESKYYKAILQNLFFAMLNSPITPEDGKEPSERHFRKLNEQGKPDRSDYDNNKLMRYESYFKNPQLFVDLANRTVPFLNGGLFDCLDEKDKNLYYDGFSDREVVKKALIVPDYLFFGEEVGKNIDLSEWYGDKKKKKVSARGIIDILKRYNFTVEENTPFDQDVSLDPELLGKVFENLLAAFNPETQTTARKQTGSFYTPREIVQYMVDESLVAHLKRTVGDDLEEQYRRLMQYTDEETSLTNEQRKQIMHSLYHCKVLDPACGSGAFPMGMLQQMVHILNRIDPDNEMWKEMMLKVAIDETSEAYRTASSKERREMVTDIERNFDESVNRPDYARKLYLVENCIYGVDIQPIAIQISKLRFFISLVVDQKTNNNPAENFGIRTLPNLEAKFVAANTLIGLDKKDVSLFDSTEIKKKENELKIAKHKIFGAKTVRTKRKYRETVNNLRLEIAALLEDCGAVGNAEAQQLASWDMFDQNASSPFFDPEWMFDVKEGFDIVIGNPPYVLLQNMPMSFADKEYIANNYYVAQYKIDLYHLFYEKGLALLNKNGILTYITPISFLKNKYNNRLRHKLVSESTICTLVRFFIPIFEASVDNVILICEKGIRPKSKINYIDIRDCLSNLIYKKEITGSVYQNTILPPSYNFEIDINKENTIINKVEQNPPLKLFAKSYFGIQTIDRKAYVSHIKRDEHYLPVIDGVNILPYILIPSSEFVNFIPSAIKSGGKSQVYNQERIVVRQIGSFPEGCICPSGLYTLNTIYNIYLWNNRLSLKYILGLINSKLIHYYWSLKYSDSKKTFPKIKKDPLDSIPICEPSNKDICNSIISYVDRITVAKDKDRNADTSFEERQIDRLVYHLYGLTYDEVLIVDPQTQITREEYEKEEIK